MAYPYSSSSGLAYDYDIFSSIRGNRLDGVKHFAKTISNLHNINSNGHCPLLEAVSCGNTAIMDFLISEYAKLPQKPNAKINPLLLAINNRSKTLIEKLLKYETQLNYLNYLDSSGYSPLAYAVMGDDREIIDLLISQDVDVTKYGKFGKPPLCVAVENENIELVKFLIEKGAERNIQSAFLSAIQTENIDIITYLKEKGAVINAIFKNCTPLVEAVKTGNVAVVKYLIENGANVKDIKDDNHLLVIKCVSEANYKMVSLLIELKVDLERAGLDGYTPLTKATQMENLKLVKILVKGGAALDLADGNGKYPLDVAIENSSLRIVVYLIESGANSELVKDKLKMLADWNYDFKLFLDIRALKNVQLGSGHEEAE